MKETTFTPGPWKAADRWGNFGDHNRHEADAPVGQVSRFSYAVADSDGLCVAHCTGPLVTMSGERSEANARLIAAAPDMYAALAALFEHCAMVHNRWGDGCNSKQAAAAIAAGRAALAKVQS